ncbi:MAG: copper amine oxidase N-terminal domain-containing protein [Oscillospiraceae bacterium]|nr:copper amine oxidase N-terminal domain-containing protein [Oscillospiraceae bacterium]
MKKIISALLTLAICTAGMSVYAETIFTEIEQVKDYSLYRIACTEDICIASAEYYLTQYTSSGWSDAIYVPEETYVIKNIMAMDNVFYMVEYSEDLEKNKFLQSTDGINWDCISEYQTDWPIGFSLDDDGNILVECPEDAELPEGFKKYQGRSAGLIGSLDVSFKGEVIDLRHPTWYTVIDADGTETEYYKPSYRSDKLIGNDDPSIFVVNGKEYFGNKPSINSQFYEFENNGKYYRIPQVVDRVSMKLGHMNYFETDDLGNIKTDDKGEIEYTYITTEYPLLNWKYSNGILYANCIVEEKYDIMTEHPSLDLAIKEWKYTTDLEQFSEWHPCDEPVIMCNMAEKCDDGVKFRFDGSERVFNVLFENEKFSDDDMIGDLYKYNVDGSNFSISKDGVYYTNFELPEKFFVRGKTKVTEKDNKFVIQSGIYQIRAPKNAIYEKVEAESVEPIYVALGDNLLAFEERPVIEDERTLIPIRFLFETMGASVNWDDETRTASIEKDGVTVTLTIDDTTAYVNGEAVTLDVPARLINGKTMVPVRFLSENLGYNVDWNDDTRMVTVE